MWSLGVMVSFFPETSVPDPTGTNDQLDASDPKKRPRCVASRSECTRLIRRLVHLLREATHLGLCFGSLASNWSFVPLDLVPRFQVKKKP